MAAAHPGSRLCWELVAGSSSLQRGGGAGNARVQRCAHHLCLGFHTKSFEMVVRNKMEGSPADPQPPAPNRRTARINAFLSMELRQCAGQAPQQSARRTTLTRGCGAPRSNTLRDGALVEQRGPGASGDCPPRCQPERGGQPAALHAGGRTVQKLSEQSAHPQPKLSRISSLRRQVGDGRDAQATRRGRRRRKKM